MKKIIPLILIISLTLLFACGFFLFLESCALFSSNDFQSAIFVLFFAWGFIISGLIFLSTHFLLNSLSPALPDKDNYELKE